VPLINKSSPIVVIVKWIIGTGDSLHLSDAEIFVVARLLKNLIENDKVKISMKNLLKNTQEVVVNSVCRTLKCFRIPLGYGKQLYSQLQVAEDENSRNILKSLQYLFNGTTREATGEFLTLADFSLGFTDNKYQQFCFFDEHEHPRQLIYNNFDIARLFLNPFANFNDEKLSHFKMVFGNIDQAVSIRNIFYLEILRGVFYKRGRREDSTKLQSLIKNLISGININDEDLQYCRKKLKEIYSSKYLTSFIISATSCIILQGKSKSHCGRQGVKGGKFLLKILGTAHRVFGFLPQNLNVPDNQLFLEPCNMEFNNNANNDNEHVDVNEEIMSQTSREENIFN